MLQKPPAPAPVLQQCMRFCSTTTTPEKKDDEPTEPQLVYEGAKNQIVGKLKKLSVANLAFAVVSAPIIQYITSAADMAGKGVAMSSLLIFFGGGTTFMCHWATTTYVMKMVTVPGRDALAITTPTFTGGQTETIVEWAQITRPKGYHPFATFEAAGTKFYLDELGDMHDEDFPKKLEAALNK